MHVSLAATHSCIAALRKQFPVAVEDAFLEHMGTTSSSSSLFTVAMSRVGAKDDITIDRSGTRDIRVCWRGREIYVKMPVDAGDENTADTLRALQERIMWIEWQICIRTIQSNFTNAYNDDDASSRNGVTNAAAVRVFAEEAWKQVECNSSKLFRATPGDIVADASLADCSVLPLVECRHSVTESIAAMERRAYMLYIATALEAEGIELRICSPHALMILVPASRVIGVVVDKDARIEVRITERASDNACLLRKVQPPLPDRLLRRRVFKDLGLRSCVALVVMTTAQIQS